MVRNINMCLPLMADEIPEGQVDLWEGNDYFTKYMYSDSEKLWCEVDPAEPNLYNVVNGAWTGYRDGDFFLIPGGNYIECLEDCLHGAFHPRIHTITDWVQENKCSYKRY